MQHNAGQWNDSSLLLSAMIFDKALKTGPFPQTSLRKTHLTLSVGDWKTKSFA